MASSTGPVKADKTAIANTVAARGRSASPGQYTSLSARGTRSQQNSTTVTAWPEGTSGSLNSPRTPRGTHGATDLRLGVAMVEFQRQAEQERRSMIRQIQQLERKFQDQLSAPAVGRERWADLQGSVSGMLEEMSALAKRVESLDEKLRLRIGGCEELTRTRTRELEQQIHAHEHKAHLATATHEEIQKRQTAKMRKVTQAVDDHARRLDAFEEIARRPDSGHEGSMLARLEARLLDFEQRQFHVEEEVRNLLTSGRPSARSSAAAAMMGLTMRRDSMEVTDSNKEGDQNDDDDAVIRNLERDFSSLAERTASQLDEHSAALANLRVRTDGQEKRLIAAAERLETVVSPPLEALRAEVLQSRDHDRQEFESRLDILSRRLQELVEASDETIIESCDRSRDMREMHVEIEQLPILKDLVNASGVQQQALQHLESLVRESQSVSPEEICGLLMRADSLEQRVDFLEKGSDGSGLEDKADRTELLRVEAALREQTEPLRRLSQRAAAAEGKTAALERRVEHLQQLASQDRPFISEGGASSTLQMQSVAPSEDVSAALTRVDVISNEVAELRARVIDVESLTDPGVGTPRLGRKPQSESVAKSSSQSCQEDEDILDQLADLRARVEELRERDSSSSPVNRIYTGQLDQALSSRISNVERKIADLSDVVKSKDLQVDERLKEAKTMVSKLREGLADLKNRVDDSLLGTPKGAQQQSIDNDILKRIEKHQHDLHRLESSCSEHGVRLTDALKAHDDRFDEFSASTSRRWEDRLSTLQESIGKLQSGSDQNVKTMTNWDDRLSTLHETVGKLQSGHDHHRETMSGWAEKLERVSSGSLSKNNEESIASVKELEKLRIDQDNMCSTLAQLAEGMKTAQTDSSKLLDEHTGRLDELDKMMKRAIDEKAGHESIATLQRELQKFEKETEQQIVKSVEKVVSDVENRITALQKDLSQLRTEDIERGEQIKNTDESLKRLQSEISTLRNDASSQPKSGDDKSMLVESIVEVLERVSSGEEASAKLHEGLEALRCKMESTLVKVTEDSERLANQNTDVFRRLESTEERIKHLTKADTGNSGIAERVAEALARTEKNEEESDRLHKMMEESLKAFDLKLQNLSSSEQNGTKEAANTRDEKKLEQFESKFSERMSRSDEDVKQAMEAISALRKEMQKTVSMVEASEEANKAVREELMCGQPHGGQEAPSGHERDVTSGHDKDLPEGTLAKLEEQVADLSDKVANELQELMKHQTSLSVMKAARADSPITSAVQKTPSDEDSGSNGVSLSKMEDAMQDLAKKVAVELGELRKHQEELVKAKESVSSISKVEEDVHEMCKQVADELNELRTHQEELGKAKDVLTRGEHPTSAHGVPQLEAKVEELNREVLTELKSLTSHQDDLKGTKANLDDLTERMERMEDNAHVVAACQKATIDLKEEVEILKTRTLSDAKRASLEPLKGKKDEADRASKKSSRSSKTAPKTLSAVVENESANSSLEADPSPRSRGMMSPVRSGLGPLGRMGLSTQAAQKTSIVEDVSEGSESYGNDAFDEENDDSMSAS